MALLWTFLVLGLLVALSYTKFEFSGNIEIQAGQKAVWDHLTKFSEYQTWNSQIIYHGGDIRLKARLKLEANPVEQQPYEFFATIVLFNEPKEFAWLSVSGFRYVFDSYHIFKLVGDENQCKVILKERYSGVLSLLIKQFPVTKRSPKRIQLFLEELKKVSEGNS